MIDDRERAPSGPCIAGSEYLIIIIIIDHRVPGADRALVIGKRTLQSGRSAVSCGVI